MAEAAVQISGAMVATSLANVPEPVLRFCRREGICGAMERIMGLAQEHFPAGHMQTPRLVCDPESGDTWVSIRVGVPGLATTDDLVRLRAGFAQRVTQEFASFEDEKVRIVAHRV